MMISLFAVGLATLVQSPFLLLSESEFMFFYPVVFLMSLKFGPVAGVISLIFSCVAHVIFFVPSLALINDHQIIHLVSFNFVCSLIIFINWKFKKSERKLHESRGWFKNALRTIGDALIVQNNNGQIIFINSIAENLIGIKRENVLGMPLVEIFHAKKNFLGQTILISANGIERPIELSRSPVVLDGRENSSGEVIVFKDISDKVSAEIRYRLAADAGEVGVWELNLLTREIEANSFFHKILGYIFFQWDFEKFIQHIHHDDREKILYSINQIVLNQGSFSTDCRIFYPDNTLRWITLSAKANISLQGKVNHIIGSIIDITSKKQIEEALQEALFYRDEFLSIASHELKTPLTSLKLQSQIFKRGLSQGKKEVFDADKMHRLMDQVDNQVTRLVRLVDDMLDISKIRTGKLDIIKEKIDLAEVVQDISERLKIQHGTHFPVLEIEDRCPVVCDKFRIEQVVNNLVLNAIRYGNGLPVKVRLQQKHDLVTLQVIDQGIGISQENHEKIFNRFQRAVPAKEISGLGLGLYIAKQIVDAHDGRIFVESEINKGATFTVELPLE